MSADRRNDPLWTEHQQEQAAEFWSRPVEPATCPECRGACETPTGDIDNETGRERVETCWTCSGDGTVPTIDPAQEATA